MRLGICYRLSEDVGPVGFHNVSGWLLSVVDAFQDGGYAAGSVCFQCLCTVAYSRLLTFHLEVGGADGCRLEDVLLEGVLEKCHGGRGRGSGRWLLYLPS